MGTYQLKTSTLHHHWKQLKPTEASLFDILPTVILEDIYIWVSVLKNCDNFKAAVKNMNSFSNPTIFAITHELWAPYHNLGVYSWYNEGFYEWAYWQIHSPYIELC